jgi:O-methyltransferase involved in polyketide biosynthesis
MEALSSDYSLQWLVAAIILFIFYGLLKIGVVFSEITKTDNGKFEGTSKTWGFHGVTHRKHQIDQKLYAAILNGLSRIVIVGALLSSTAFIVTLV